MRLCFQATTATQEPVTVDAHAWFAFCDVRNNAGKPARARCTTWPYRLHCAYLPTNLFRKGQCTPKLHTTTTTSSRSKSAALFMTDSECQKMTNLIFRFTQVRLHPAWSHFYCALLTGIRHGRCTRTYGVLCQVGSLFASNGSVIMNGWVWPVVLHCTRPTARW